MGKLGHKLKRDSGWTFIEATLSIVVMSIMILGLTIVLLAFREHLDRSWALRAMDQYGNDALEMLTHEMRNGVDVTVRLTGDTDRITVKWLDPWVADLIHSDLWYADLRAAQIKKNNKPIDELFPPRRLRRGESYQIVKFWLLKYGEIRPGMDVRDMDNPKERLDAFSRSKAYKEATYTIWLTLRYTRGAINPGDKNWKFEKTYKNTVYLRNKNLVFQKGIIGT